MKKRSLCCLFLVSALFCMLLGGCSSGAADASGSSFEYKTLVVGSDNYPPYVFNDESGNPTGIDVDILTEALHRIGYEPRFTTISWEEKNQLLDSGRIDCVMACFSMTGRENEYRWAGPYMKSRQVVAVDPASDIQSLSDLEGKVIAVQSTTKPESILLQRLNDAVPDIKAVISFSNRDYLGPALAKGYADAIAAHETSIMQYSDDYGFECRILDDPLLEVGLGCAFSLNDDRGIDQQLSRVFDEMRADGSMEAVLAKYLDNPSSYLDLESLDE